MLHVLFQLRFIPLKPPKRPLFLKKHGKSAVESPVAPIENHRTELIWRLMRDCPHARTGLQRAGFRGGWL
jgi:hypothetical protein